MESISLFLWGAIEERREFGHLFRTPHAFPLMTQPTTMDDLAAPLLPHPTDAIIDVDVNPFHHHHPGAGVDNPFAFLGALLPSLPPPSTIDPFRNATPNIHGAYEWAKILLCLPIAALRLLLFGLSLLVGYLATRFALEGWKDRHNPMPPWRSGVMWITRISSRCVLFSFGYHWIRRIGKPAPREVAPIVVSNHISYVEPIFFFYELFPTIVASESHDSIPFVGTIIRAMQVIYVDRFSAQSRKNAVAEIKRKGSSDNFPRVLLFPEGTTTNGRVLISFQLGAFIPGYPIQPVVVRYPHVFFDQSWGNIPLMKLMFRMFTQFHNFMEVEYLPVIYPLDDRKETASQFAERTGCKIATALNVKQTSHSYGDLLLLNKALESKSDAASAFMVEMAWAENVFGISTIEALDFLDQFLAMSPDACGYVKFHDFTRGLNFPVSPLSEKVFRFLDVEKRGSITFRQFLLGSARVMKQPLFLQACTSAFDACDEEGKGCVTKQQFLNVIGVTASGCSDGNVFGVFDIDNDGIIGWEDFITGFRKNPLLIALFSSCFLCTELDFSKRNP